MRFIMAMSLAAGLLAPVAEADPLSGANMIALRGLVPFSVLGNNAAGKQALHSNYIVTGAIQTGTAGQPALLPFAGQRQHALQDAFITGGNARQLADGLGTKLGGAYQELTSYAPVQVCKPKVPPVFKGISDNVTNLIEYSSALTGSDSNAAKYFFANGTIDGKIEVDADAAKIMTDAGGAKDVFGTAYNDPAGGEKADPYGDSRPFQTETNFTPYEGMDYFGVGHKNRDYLDGPVQCLQTSPSFPSGHTTYGFTESLLLAFMVPERFGQMITRGAEYGNDRIIIGAHYAMDVIAGRSLAYYDMAHLLEGAPSYEGQKEGNATLIGRYIAALQAARDDLRAALEMKCGGAIAVCAKMDTGRFSNPAANAAFYESTQTYGLPVVYPATAGKVEDVATLAPEAGYLLTAAFPDLTLAQADKILTSTEGPGGGFLDNGSGFGVYSRLDLYRAGLQAVR